MWGVRGQGPDSPRALRVLGWQLALSCKRDTTSGCSFAFPRRALTTWVIPSKVTWR